MYTIYSMIDMHLQNSASYIHTHAHYLDAGPTELPICSDLTAPTNGVISYSDGGSTDDRQVDSTATHSCDSGYRLVGEVVRTCGVGGSWNGTTPTCQCIVQYIL